MHGGVSAEQLAEALAMLPADLHQSPLLNSELAPVPPSKRTWTTYDFCSLWISMAHCLPTYYLAGGLLAVGMNWWQSLIIICLGNTIVLVPILANSHAGTEYGISFPVFARAAFGTVGVHCATLIRAAVSCGWFGIESYIGGQAIKTFVVNVWPDFADLGGSFTLFGIGMSSLLCMLFFWALNLLLLFKGMAVIRVFENIAAPLVLVMAALLAAFVCYKAGGLGPIFTEPATLSPAEFASIFPKSLMSMIAYWTSLSLNIPDFTRFGKSHREQMLGQVAGLPTTMTGFSFLGIVITSAAMGVLPQTPASELWDPVRLLALLTSSTPPPGLSEPVIANAGIRWIVAVLAVSSVVIATISVNIAANCVSPSNDFMNVFPTWMTFQKGALVAGVVALLYMPWKLLASSETFVFDWLLGYSVFLGPCAGVLVADYHLWRRRRLHLAELYRPDGYYAGVSWVAVAALLLAIAINVPGLVYHNIDYRTPSLDWLDAMHEYGWLTGFVASIVFYLVLKHCQRRWFPLHRAAVLNRPKQRDIELDDEQQNDVADEKQVAAQPVAVNEAPQAVAKTADRDQDDENDHRALLDRDQDDEDDHRALLDRDQLGGVEEEA